MKASRKVYDKTYKQRKVEKTAKKIEKRVSGCNCYLRELGQEAMEKQYHDPFCGVWLIGKCK
jgi:hypothetical protein